MARPQSEVRIALSAELVEGAGTCRELWRRMGCIWPMLAVRIALTNMVAAGDVVLAPSVRVPGVRRPVPVYRRPNLLERDAACPPHSGAGIRDLIACWAGLAAAQRMGSAM